MIVAQTEALVRLQLTLSKLNLFTPMTFCDRRMCIRDGAGKHTFLCLGWTQRDRHARSKDNVNLARKWL